MRSCQAEACSRGQAGAPRLRPSGPAARRGDDSRLTSSSAAKPAAQLVTSAKGPAAAAMAPAAAPLPAPPLPRACGGEGGEGEAASGRALPERRGGARTARGEERDGEPARPPFDVPSLPRRGGWCGPPSASRC